MIKQTFKYFLFLFLTATALTACGNQASIESPEAVLDKAKQVLTDVSSGLLDVSVNAEGNNGMEDISFQGEAALAFDKRDKNNPKLDLEVNLSGNLQTDEQGIKGDLAFNFMGIDQEYYVRLKKLSGSDPSLESIQPFINLYIGKWLRIAEDFIPPNIRDLQSLDEATMLKKKQLDDIFAETKLFDVVKEYGVKSLNGRKVHHYGLMANEDGFKDYMLKTSALFKDEASASGVFELVDKQLEEVAKVLSYLKEAEVYIDTENYYVLKYVFRISGGALDEKGNFEVGITVEGSDFNEDVPITAPKGAEDFNPLNLMMGLGGGGTLEENPAGDESGVPPEDSFLILNSEEAGILNPSGEVMQDKDETDASAEE